MFFDLLRILTPGRQQRERERRQAEIEETGRYRGDRQI